MFLYQVPDGSEIEVEGITAIKIRTCPGSVLVRVLLGAAVVKFGDREFVANKKRETRWSRLTDVELIQ